MVALRIYLNHFITYKLYYENNQDTFYSNLHGNALLEHGIRPKHHYHYFAFKKKFTMIARRTQNRLYQFPFDLCRFHHLSGQLMIIFNYPYQKNKTRDRIILISAITLIASLTAFGQDTINSTAYGHPLPISDFEDRDTANYFYFDTTQPNNIWQIGIPSKTVFDSAYSAPHALMTDSFNTYPASNQSSFEFVVFTNDLTYIAFWHRFDTDSLKDGGIIEVSKDNGSTWTNIVYDTLNGFFLNNFYAMKDTISSINSMPGFTGNSGGWQYSVINKARGMNHYRFRFTFSSDTAENSRDGWMIDNFAFICLGTSIEEIGSNVQIKLYPNPMVGQFSINTVAGLKLKNIKIYDNSGRIFHQGTEKTIDTSRWASGLYFVEVATDQGIVKKKMIKINMR